MSARPKQQDQEKTTQVLLEVMKALLAELHPHETRPFKLTLDSSLDKDLHLDSLSRVELISRLEQYFNAVLSQRVFVDSETPRDLLRAINSARARKDDYLPLPVTEPITDEVESTPRDATTLIEVLEWHVRRHPDHLHIHIIGDGEETTLTYVQLWQGAKKVAAGLQQRGVQPGDTIAIMLPTGSDYFFSFFAILLAGAIPVPIYPPVRRSQLEEHMLRHSGILNNCMASVLITVPQAKVIARLLKSQVASLRHVVTISDITSTSGNYFAPVIGPCDIAFLQYTSGSTGNPKGVVLTHANLLANIRVMGEAINASSKDVFVSWLPLYHDMGLIGAWLATMYFSVQLVVMSPLVFLTHPQRWLRTIHQYRGTLSASPNFGYELCLKRIRDKDLQGLDLSSWRLAFNGAEPVSPDTIEKFTQRFQSVGFQAENMMPVYGLAESSVGLAFPPLNREPLIDCVQRDTFTQTGHAIPADDNDKNRLCFVASGRPLQGHQVRIVDSNGRELPERQEGVLEFRGPSVTTGYYRNPEATRELFDHEWLDSGDLAYIAEGDIYITGRSKDVIIHAGRNVYPHELEEVIGNVPDVRKGCVVAFGAADPRTGTERLIILVETKQLDTAQKTELHNKIISAATDLLGLRPDEVLLVPPHTVLKTSSGKIRRSACRELYQQGLLGKAQRSVWVQFVYIAGRSLLPVWRRLGRQLKDSLYAGYTLILFTSLACVAWTAVMILPRLSWRWSVLRALARVMAFASGTKINIKGLQNLPPQDLHSIYVANHASYIDSFALVAAIPRDFVFVAKVELRKNPFLRIPLERVKVEFVERFDKSRGVIDAQRITQTARHSKALLFFPEGTFTRIPGVTDFHMGAFITAAQMNFPVVPVAIRGTRSILRGGSIYPRHGQISINIGQAITPSELPGVSHTDKWRTALILRDGSREHILRHCGEPSLEQ